MASENRLFQRLQAIYTHAMMPICMILHYTLKSTLRINNEVANGFTNNIDR